MIVRSAAAHCRIARAKAWLRERNAGEPVLIVAADLEGAHDLVRELAAERGAVFGWQRITLGRLAATVAAPSLAARGRIPIGTLGAEAIALRAVQSLRANCSLGRYEAIAQTPGFARAIAQCLTELRFARLTPEALEEERPELRALFESYVDELDRAGLVDRAAVFEAAVAAAHAPGAQCPLLGIPTLLLDLPVGNPCEGELINAVLTRSPASLATLARGDSDAERHLVAALGPADTLVDVAPDPTPLGRLQRGVFDELKGPETLLGDEVVVLSAPGEARECVEIARHIHRFTAAGVAFDRMAVLLRSPEEYQAHLAEAFRRGGIPAYFARGLVYPDPSGRAFCALLGCARERFSAARFAEYLSLGEVPEVATAGAPPDPAGDRWVAPDEGLLPEALAVALAALAADSPGWAGDAGLLDPLADPVGEESMRVSRHWERLLMDAAVIGGRDRWERRLRTLAHSLALARDRLEDPDGPEGSRLERRLADLEALRHFALPLIEALAALPKVASWADWLERLADLATRALREPEPVLAGLAELTPLGPVGPVDLDEVSSVLSRRLLRTTITPEGSRYGRVFVAPIEAARGLSFEAVFIPGLAERLFPRKIQEEPILLDDVRETLGMDLATNPRRIDRERLALRLAVGASAKHLLLSYPRLDIDQGRPRVPSFYALELLRAAEGTLPGFAALAARAERSAAAHIGWPAPERRTDAIDDAEHDLALLEALLELPPDESVGTARYLLGANPHLGRALRFRARRWLRSWTVADGLVAPVGSADDAIRTHRLEARSFSPTALQTFATCPYKFLLHAIHKLTPREVPQAVEELDPLQRGSLVHEIQFEVLSALSRENLLPLDPDHFPHARAILDHVTDEVAERYAEELAPAITRVWEDGIAAVRADLREWLRRLRDDESGFVPWRFELSFGLGPRRSQDPHSRTEPVALDCGIGLRGSIDLIERGPENRLRVTDHKTGRIQVQRNSRLEGGRSLQPTLYALAVEKLFPGQPVEAGRLYYCTTAGAFHQHVVPLDDRARADAQIVADTVGSALEEPFLPAAPLEQACRWCDYRVVCGPHEELRVQRKLEREASRARLAGLTRLRALR